MKSEYRSTALKLIGLKQDLLNLCSVDESLKVVYHKFLETLAAAEKTELLGDENVKRD